MGAGAGLPDKWLRSLRLRMLNSSFSTTAQIAVMAMPLWVIGSIQTGRRAKKSGRTTGTMPMPMLTAPSNWLRRSVMLASWRIWMPLAATMPNMAMPAPPSTAGGIEATRKAALGSMLRRIRKPAAATVT